jgi:iron complex outermembrane recepter protein
VALPLRGLEATLNYAYLNTRYLKWSSQKVDAQGNPAFTAPNNDIPIMENVANQRNVPISPDHTIAVGLTYTAPPTSAGVASAHVDACWQDSVVNNNIRPQYNNDGNYALFNIRLQLVDIPLQKCSLAIAAYEHNLADRKYRTMGFDLGPQLGWSVNTYGDPRTFGLQLTYNFNES